MTVKFDKILLDARLLDGLGSHAFQAVLKNGHSFIAHQAAKGSSELLRSGGTVPVEFSPYDMSKARIIM